MTTIELKEEFKPESKHWKKGYWIIPNNKPLKVIQEERDEILIEYLDASFYIPKDKFKL